MRDKRRPIAASALSRVTLPRHHHPSASSPHTFHNNYETTTRSSTTTTTATKTMPPSYKNSTTEEVELLATGSDVEKGSGELSPTAPYSSKTNIFSSAASVKAMTSCLLYSFCSVSMILVNKSLASR
jgi:hypothetical protein